MDRNGPLPMMENPPLGYRFDVSFLNGGTGPNAVDIFFQSVSGLGCTVETTPLEEGGQNLYTQKLPRKIAHENLVLKRGLAAGSPLALEFNETLSRFAFSPSNVLVSLLDEARNPVSAWLFINAYPVKWSLTDLDAESGKVVVEHMELTYQNMQVMRI